MSSRFLLEEQLTIVSTQTLRKLFKEKFGADAVALYMFYYYTAKWQETNQPKATAGFCMKGLGWGEIRFMRAKKILQKYGLIEDVVTKDEGGKIVAWYVKIKYLWKKETIKKIKTTTLKTHPVVKQGTNALSVNNIKCLKDNKGKKKFSSLKDIAEQDLVEIAEKYNVPVGFVSLQLEKMTNWLGAKGKTYKNYRRGLMNWVLSGAEDYARDNKRNSNKQGVDARSLPKN